RRVAAAEIRLCRGVRAGQFLNGSREFVADFDFLGIEHFPGLRQSEFDISYLGMGLAESDGHRQLEAESPAGLTALREGLVEAVQSLCGAGRISVVIIQQLIAEAVYAILGDEVQSGPREAAGRLQLTFEALDIPPLLAEFDTAGE